MSTEEDPKYTSIRILPATKAKLDRLCSEDRRSLIDELDVLLDKELRSREAEPVASN